MALAAVAGAGVAFQALGGLKSANDQYDAAQRNIDNLNLQAQEQESRNKLNLQKEVLAGNQLIANQQGAFAASGVDLSAGAPLQVMEQTANTISQELVQTQRENAFYMNQLRFQSTEQATVASQNRTAGYVGLLGQGILSGTQAYNSVSGNKNAKAKQTTTVT